MEPEQMGRRPRREPFDFEKHAPAKPITELVLWAPSPDSEPSPAIVTAVGVDSISVAVFAPEGRGVTPKEGVRHRLDPGFGRLIDQSGGVWDYSNVDKRITEAMAAAAQACAQMAELNRKMEDLGYAKTVRQYADQNEVMTGAVAVKIPILDETY